MGGGAQAGADAPVVDTAEQVMIIILSCKVVFLLLPKRICKLFLFLTIITFLYRINSWHSFHVCFPYHFL